MTVLLVSLINILFILFIYFIFSKRVRQLEERRLPEAIENEIDSVLTTFNQAADRNIDLLDDRIAKLKPLVNQAEKSIVTLEGAIRRAEALQKQKQLIADAKSVQPSLFEAVEDSRSIESMNGAAISANAYEKHVPQKDKKTAPKKVAKKKSSRRRKKSKEERLLEMFEAGSSAEEIASKLGMTSEEVLLKQRMLAKS